MHLASLKGGFLSRRSADAEAVANQQHPDHQLRIDRGAARVTVEGLEPPANVTEIEEAIADYRAGRLAG